MEVSVGYAGQGSCRLEGDEELHFARAAFGTHLCASVPLQYRKEDHVNEIHC